MDPSHSTDILVAGGGFAGLAAALNAAGEITARDLRLRVALAAREPFLTIRPRLYEAHGEHLRVPLRPLLAQAGIDFIEGEISEIDTHGQRVHVHEADGGYAALGFQRLVLATGSRLRRPAIPGAVDQAHDIDDWEGARRLEARLTAALAKESGPEALSVAILGAGMSGIELACELRPRLRALGGEEAAARTRIVLLEQARELAPGFGEEARPVIAEALALAGVELWTGRRVTRIDAGGLQFEDGTWLPAAVTVLATGMEACLPAAGLEAARRDEAGRLLTDDALRVAGLPAVFAAGDAAHATVEDGRVALMSCQHARTMGKFAGGNALRDLLGEPLLPYRQTGYSTCLDLGEYGAVHTLGWERRVHAKGQDAKRRKLWINRELIYPPPAEQGREALFAFGRVDPATGR